MPCDITTLVLDSPPGGAAPRQLLAPRHTRKVALGMGPLARQHGGIPHDPEPAMPFYQPPSFAAAASVGRTLAGEFPFATLITQYAGTPWISHLVLLPDPADPDSLLGHLAAANGHSQAVLQAPSVAIFHGEHEYISPRWYSTPNMVPTWNYRVAHAHGQAQQVAAEELPTLLQQLATRFEGPDGWNMDTVPEQALNAMQRAIVGFRLRVARWEVKEKLSQNRTPQDVAGAVQALQAGNPQQQQLAARMLAVVAR